MTTVRIGTFGGMIPAIDDHLLQDTAAVLSENTYLYSGKLRPLPQPELIKALTAGTAKVYRVPYSYTDSENINNSFWMEFPHIDTDVVRTPVVNDQYDRYYWACPSDVPRYNTRERIENGDPAFKLGIPLPGSIGLEASGGISSVTVSRSYAVTWVSAYGEEGPAQVTDVVNGKQDDVWTVTLPAPAAGDLGTDRNLQTARIYRTVTSLTGQATYFLVDEVEIATTSYDDSADDEEITANEQLASLNWVGPENLDGWVMMHNGILAGWKGSDLYFSEPYRPHAWPAAYGLSMEYPIVGLGVFNQTLVICTEGFPMMATGTTPINITTSTISNLEPCMSRGSIISAPEGVYYASPNGLVVVANGVAANVTRKLVLKDDWNTLLKVPTLRASRLGDGYYCYGSARYNIIQENISQEGVFGSLDYSGAYVGALIDPHNERVAFNTLSSAVITTNIMTDPWSGEIFIIRNNNLYRINMSDPEPDMEVCKWRSKIFQTPEKKNFVAMKVFFTVPVGTPAQGGSRDNTLVQSLETDEYGLVRVYADGVLRMTRELRTSGELWRLPSGFKADFWQIEFETRINVLSVQMATSVKELARA